MKKIDNPKKQATIALKKANTHIDKIIKMIDEDRYCVDILEQLLAVNGLIKSASSKILKNHMRTCFLDGMQSESRQEKDQLIQEVLDLINLSNKK